MPTGRISCLFVYLKAGLPIYVSMVSDAGDDGSRPTPQPKPLTLLDVLRTPGLGPYVASFACHFAAVPAALMRTSPLGHSLANELLAATEHIRVSSDLDHTDFTHGGQLVQRLVAGAGRPGQLRTLSLKLWDAQWPRISCNRASARFERYGSISSVTETRATWSPCFHWWYAPQPPR
jgi:hypothetical protein